MAQSQVTIGELSLSKLLASLKPILDPSTYVFINLPFEDPLPTTLPMQMLFREREGITVITTQEAARAQKFNYTFPCRMITLDVHSSLEAVGFMAAISNTLRKLNMGVNPVSGYFHDHCFVPVGREDEAMEALLNLAGTAKRGIISSFTMTANVTLNPCRNWTTSTSALTYNVRSRTNQ
jgi:hypothetical protein